MDKSAMRRLSISLPEDALEVYARVVRARRLNGERVRQADLIREAIIKDAERLGKQY